MTFLQKVKRELGRETQPVDTIVRLIIIERAVRGTLVAILGGALLTNSRGIVTLVRGWVAELNINPERRLIPRILSAVLKPIGQFSPRTVLLIGVGALLFGALELTEAIGLARRRIKILDAQALARVLEAEGAAEWSSMADHGVR